MSKPWSQMLVVALLGCGGSGCGETISSADAGTSATTDGGSQADAAAPTCAANGGQTDAVLPGGGKRGLGCGVAIDNLDLGGTPTGRKDLRLTTAAVDCSTNFQMGFPPGVYLKVELDALAVGTLTPVSMALLVAEGGVVEGLSGTGEVVLTKVTATSVEGSLSFLHEHDGKTASASGGFSVVRCDE